ncbi:MAG: amidase [Pseudomonadota bacterium]
MQKSPADASGRHYSWEFELWDRKLHAFVYLGAPQLAAPNSHTGSLSNITVGVKDIIDVAGMPTRNGSETCSGAAAAEADATVVAALRRAGARIVGKTMTTEFAFTDPTDCRNPYDLDRSPGGSSSGSGAAVAAGMVDIALGTQTAGSLCRPAAYCGAVGFKPSYGVLPTTGVTPLAPSFDTVGVIARTVALAERAFDAMRPGAEGGISADKKGITTTTLLLDATTKVAPETMEALQEADESLRRAGLRIQPPDLKMDMADVVADHRTAMNFEAFRAHGHLLMDDRKDLLKPKFRAGLELGSGVSRAEMEAALERLAETRQNFWRLMTGVDAVLTLPVPDGAPLMGGTTGFQDWLTPWTVFGGPLVCLPWGLDALGRPRSVMLAGRPGEDVGLLTIAKTLEADAPRLHLPDLPA